MAASSDSAQQNASLWEATTYGEVVDLMKSNGVSSAPEDGKNMFKALKWEVEKRAFPGQDPNSGVESDVQKVNEL